MDKADKSKGSKQMSNELPIPPGVPEWFLEFPQEKYEYIRAAVYAQLWREEMDRISRHTPYNTEQNTAYESDYFQAETSAQTCANAMMERMQMITKERMIEFLEDARKFDSIIERDKLERKVDELEKALERKAGELVKALERIPGHCKEEE